MASEVIGEAGEIAAREAGGKQAGTGFVDGAGAVRLEEFDLAGSHGEDRAAAAQGGHPILSDDGRVEQLHPGRGGSRTVVDGEL